MNDANKLSRELIYEIADGLAQASSLILAKRIDLRLEPKPTDQAKLKQREKDEDQLEQFENHLDQMVALFRAYGIYLLGQAAQDPIASITAAVAHAQENLKTVRDIKLDIMTASRLIDLGAAILSRNPVAMIEAAESLKNEARN